jgi:hypothetical protein
LPAIGTLSNCGGKRTGARFPEANTNPASILQNARCSVRGRASRNACPALTVLERLPQPCTDPATAIQAVQAKSARTVKGGFKMRSKRQTHCNLPCRGWLAVHSARKASAGGRFMRPQDHSPTRLLARHGVRCKSVLRVRLQTCGETTSIEFTARAQSNDTPGTASAR